VPPPARPAIDERAARRAALEARGADRYDALLRHLQAGHELPVVRAKRSFGVDIHPSFGRLILVALLVAAAWLGAIAVTDWLRQGRVDTWTGPDASVQSGLRLDGCPDIVFRENVYFPSWVRFEGKLFRWADSLTPIGPNSVPTSFEETGYVNGDLRLYRVHNNPEGRAGNQVMIRQGDAPAGAIYVIADCG
jgi:hypothetical protein